MLSQTCKMAIKAVIYLCCKSRQGERAGIQEVARAIDASEHTVGKVLQSLARQGHINSTKGPSGGFFINEAQQRQPIISIVQTIDGNSVFRECGLGLSKCSATHPCPIHDEYKVARDHIENLFKQKCIGDLCESVNNGYAYLIG